MSRLEPLIASGSAIAIVGMAGRFPGARNVQEYWNNIREGVESIRRLSDAELEARGVPASVRDDPAYVQAAAVLEGMDHFDAGFFGFSPRDAAILDPQHRHFLEVAWEVLEDAGHIPERFDGPIGVFAGSGTNSYFWANLMTNPELVRDVGFFLLRHTGNDKDFLSTRISYELNLTGPSVNVQTACSTSLVAVHMAAQSLLLNECDMALAGGVTIEQPHGVGYLYQEREILSPDGHCRPFEARAKGTVFGSAVGLVALRRLEDAVADGDQIHAVVLGSAINNDGSMKVGYLAPSVDGQARAIAEALGVSGVDPGSIGYLEAHGTGTEVGDPIEVAALTQAFRTGTDRTGYCALGSVKANIGHADTAAGVAGLIKTVLALKARERPPMVHYTEPNSAIDFESSPFFASSSLQEWQGAEPRRAGVSSLGVGGTNAFVVLEEAPALPSGSPAGRPLQFLPFSGRSERVREASGADLASFLESRIEDPSPEPGFLADAAWTLAVGRRGFRFRRVVLAESSEEAVDALVTADSDRVISGEVMDPVPGVSFLFAGGGAQYPGMGAGLYRDEPVYRAVVDESLSRLDARLAETVRRLLLDPRSNEPGENAETEADSGERAPSERPSVALPALFITQLAQARLWLEWGIRPAAMIGHSMGEYTAACLSGVLTPADALGLVVLRGRLFEEVPEGGMLSVPLPEEELGPLLPGGVSIAAVNAPELTVASGPVAKLAELEEVLARQAVEFRRVRISVAAHSAMLDPILERFRDAVSEMPLGAPTIPFASNLSGDWITEGEATDPDYWMQQLRGTVRFADGVRRLAQEGSGIFLEVGPGRTLATLARLCVTREEVPEIFTSMRHPDDGEDDLRVQLATLASLWTRGVEVDWDGFFAGDKRRRVSLPTYPFERERYFIEPGRGVPLQLSPDTAPASRDADSPTGRASGTEGGQPTSEDSIDGWFWEHAWEPAPLSSKADVREKNVEKAPFLLIGRASPFGEALAGSLEKRGIMTVGPLGVEEAGSTLEAQGEAGLLPSGAIYLSLLDPDPELDLSEGTERAFHSPHALLRAVGEADPEEDFSLLFPCVGMHRIEEGDRIEPWKALALGPIRTAPRELGRIRTRSIDLEPGPAGQAESLAEILAGELAAAEDDRVVAYRGGRRHRQCFRPGSLRSSEGASPIQSDGGYLITGGLGGLGLAFAHHLVEKGACGLILLSRSGLPPRSRWESWLRDYPATEPAVRGIRAVRSLEAQGCLVEVAAVDVTNREGLVACLSRAEERVGQVRGVIHAAGVLDDEPLLSRTPERAERVLAPKVRGTLALSQALGAHRLDFEILCSSRSAISGAPGQIDYTSANAFLDAWAEAAHGSGGRLLSIEWDAWRDTGMAHDLATSTDRASRLDGAEAGAMDGAPEYLDHPIFLRRTRNVDGDVHFSARFAEGLHWMLDEHRIRGGSPLIPGTGFLELIRAAFELQEGSPFADLRDILFLEPFIVPEGTARELVVRLRPSREGYDVAVLGRVADAARETPWMTHVTGQIAGATGAVESHIEVSELWDRMPAPRQNGLNGRRAGPTGPAGSGLELGPRWTNLCEMRTAGSEAVLRLELAEAFRGDLSSSALHPALVDVATAGAQELIEGYDAATQFYIPASYGSLRLHAPLPPVLISHVRYRGMQVEGMATFDVRIFDEAGVELAVVEDFVMVRIENAVELGEAPSPPATDAGGSSGGTDTPPAAVLSAGITTSGGLRVLDRLLHTDPWPAVIAVVPRDLNELLAELDQGAGPSGRTRQAAADDAADVSALEESLIAHPAIHDAAAVAHRYGPGEVRVVAFIVYDPVHRATVSELRRHVRAAVDSELVPQNFVEMTEIPRDRRGRLDRSQVKDPLAPKDDHVPPRTPTEQVLARIWSRLLGLERVSIHDNFLDIGGHSLVGIRVLVQIEKETGVRLHPNALTLQTLEQLAAECDRQSAAAEVPEPAQEERGLAGRLVQAVKQSVSRSDR